MYLLKGYLDILIHWLTSWACLIFMLELEGGGGKLW